MSEMTFIGRGKKLDDIDLPRIASKIGVGEDELHAFMEVETNGRGFDSKGRPVILFEPHIFWRMLPKEKRARAAKEKLAAPKWGQIPYVKDSYSRLHRAMKIDKEAALKSCSWGYSQIMGFNYSMVGYRSVDAMVKSFMDDEENHIIAMVDFIIASGIDDEMRELAKLTGPTYPKDCIPIVAVYNGSGFRKNRYHIKFAEAHNKWRGIPDTPWEPGQEEPEEPKQEPSGPKPEEPKKPESAIGRLIAILFKALSNLKRK